MGDIIDRCPICKELPTIGTNALSGKPMVACMNCGCPNMKSFIADDVGAAMVEWNNWCKTISAKEITEYRNQWDMQRNRQPLKCRHCRWLDLNQKIVIGCLCTNPKKQFKTETAQWKYPSARACKLFEERKDDML